MPIHDQRELSLREEESTFSLSFRGPALFESAAPKICRNKTSIRSLQGVDTCAF